MDIFADTPSGIKAPHHAFIVKTGQDRRIKGMWIYKNGLKRFFNEFIEVEASASVNLVASSMFTAEEWQSQKPKKIIIPSGVEIGSNNPAVAALSTGTGRAGDLIIENNGILSGAGGVANSGTGGNAFSALETVDFINNGIVRSGGGGGGHGGIGGPGYYTTIETEGPHGYWGSPSYTARRNTDGTWSFQWVGAAGTNSWGWLPHNVGNPYSAGGWSYTNGPVTNPNNNGEIYYQIQRSRTLTHYTTGGSRGLGGRGQGYNHAADAGLIGGNGGINAGGGGWGGNGGGWGASGADGSNGASGNNGSGTVGLAGGFTGFAYQNSHLVNLTENGTSLGR